jgi:hypothetical protein
LDRLPQHRGIAVVLHDIGRAAIAQAEARRLLTESHDDEARQREAAERQAIELDYQRRAQPSGGIPARLIPEDVLPAAAMLQAARDDRPPRVIPLQEAWTNSGELTYHSFHGLSDEEGVMTVPDPLAADGQVSYDPVSQSLLVKVKAGSHAGLLWRQGHRALFEAEEAGRYASASGACSWAP